MDPSDYRDGQRRGVPSLVAWLSICLLAAGWGARFGSSLRETWIMVGAFGLICAVGLDISFRVRSHRKALRQQKSVQRRIEKNLAGLARQQGSLEDLRGLLGGIIDAAAFGQEPAPLRPEPGSEERRARPRFELSRPVKLTPIGENGHRPGSGNKRSVAGQLCNLSAAGFGLIHREPIEEQRVLMTFEDIAEHPIHVLVELQWTQPKPGGRYVSGGKLAGLVPASPERRAAPAAHAC